MRLLVLALALTTAAQAQWEILPTPTTADLRGIHAVSPEIAWASGTDGTVLRTTDGGTHWTLCPTPPKAEHLDFRGIQAFDAQTAIVMSSGKGDLSRLYKTTDACAHWTLLFTNPDPEGFWDAVQFRLRDGEIAQHSCLGVILGDPVANRFALFVSVDCGQTWERQKTVPEALQHESAFAASNSSLQLRGVLRSFVTGGPSGPRELQFSTYVDWYALDGQRPANSPPYEINQWFTEPLPCANTEENSGAFSLGERDEQWNSLISVVVGGNYKTPDRSLCTGWYRGQYDTRLKTYWHHSQTPPHGYRSSVVYSPAAKSWITVGPNGTDISTDDGRNWRPLRPSPTDAPDADRNWNALGLPYVVGPHGRIGKLRPTALPDRR